MSELETLPRAMRPFVDFPSVLRAHGFAVAPDQTTGFIEAVGLLGPVSMADIYQAALAMLAPPRQRREEFDALFRFVFHGHSLEGVAPGEDSDEEMIVTDDRDGFTDPPEADEISESGEDTARAEVLAQRQFTEAPEAEVLRKFRRLGPARLPRRTSYRKAPAKTGRSWNMRRSLRDAVRRDGEVLVLPKLDRKTRQRRVLLLIDVSGSMKAQTDTYLRFAHTLARICDAFEVFTFGTRLTRVTRALRLRNLDQALYQASHMVADWDGGTRIGDALGAYLGVPRFAGFARGALVLILSDGLERGEPDAMVDAVERLSRLAWRVSWMTPLAADAEFAPKTRALQAILPYLDDLGDGSSAARLCDHVMSIQGRRAA